MNRVTDLTPTLSLAERHDGFWLYDETRGMNLAMKARTSTDAFVEALTYYQGRLQGVESELRDLSKKVEAFIGSIAQDHEDLLPYRGGEDY